MASDEPPRQYQGVVTRHVDVLARSVLTSLRTYPTTELRAKLSRAASDVASLSMQAGDFDPDSVLADFKTRNLQNADLMDYVIPEAALTVGQGWHEDAISFWQVSLSGARLYNLVKRISAEWASDAAGDDRTAVL